MTKCKVPAEILQAWGTETVDRLHAAILAVYADGSIEYDAEHPAWIAERFRRREVLKAKEVQHVD